MQPGARSDWIVAICSVVFDLDVGQQLESVCPPDALSEATASAVAFHSFPVSHDVNFVPSVPDEEPFWPTNITIVPLSLRSQYITGLPAHATFAGLDVYGTAVQEQRA